MLSIYRAIKTIKMRARTTSQIDWWHARLTAVSLGCQWPDYIVTLDERDFDNFIQKYPLSIVDFWASWCAPCRAMAPRLRRLSKIYKAKVAFGKLDTQKHQDIAKKNKIMGIPHLVFFSYGKKISSLTGVKSVGDIKDIIDALIKKVK